MKAKKNSKLPRIDFERRAGERVSRVFPVRLLAENLQPLETQALDVSRTGVRIVAPIPLPENELLRLELELEPELRLSLLGTPVWSQELNRAGLRVVGLHFSGGQEAEVDLDRWIMEHSAA